jgi:hypothetical protein
MLHAQLFFPALLLLFPVTPASSGVGLRRLSITPSYADIRGGATVTLSGAAPFASPVAAEVHCGFGSVWVPAVLSPGGGTVHCTVPAAPGGALGSVVVRVRIDPLTDDQGEATLTYYDESALPVVSEVRPDIADDARPQQLRVLGSNFAPLAPEAMRCAFGSDGPTAATFVSPSELACASPAAGATAAASVARLSHTVELRVSLDGRRFSMPGEAAFHLVTAQ